MGRLSRSASSARRAEAMLLLSQNVKLGDMATLWGLTEGGARAYIRRLSDPVASTTPLRSKTSNPNYGRYKMYGNEPRWQNADPSTLSPEHKAYALLMGIKPSRYAWLLQCPRGGNAGGDKKNRSLR